MSFGFCKQKTLRITANALIKWSLSLFAKLVKLIYCNSIIIIIIEGNYFLKIYDVIYYYIIIFLSMKEKSLLHFSILFSFQSNSAERVHRKVPFGFKYTRNKKNSSSWFHLQIWYWRVIVLEKKMKFVTWSLQEGFGRTRVPIILVAFRIVKGEEL